MNTQNTVHITQQQKANSQKLKREKVRTIHQQQVYRAAQNLFYVLAQMRKTCPVKFRAVLEPSYAECTSLLASLSLAYMEPNVRIAQLTIAAAHIDTLKTILGILRSLGCISKDDYKKARSLVQSCAQQVMAWRASTMISFEQGNAEQNK